MERWLPSSILKQLLVSTRRGKELNTNLEIQDRVQSALMSRQEFNHGYLSHEVYLNQHSNSGGPEETILSSHHYCASYLKGFAKLLEEHGSQAFVTTQSLL